MRCFTASTPESRDRRYIYLIDDEMISDLPAPFSLAPRMTDAMVCKSVGAVHDSTSRRPLVFPVTSSAYAENCSLCSKLDYGAIHLAHIFDIDGFYFNQMHLTWS